MRHPLTSAALIAAVTLAVVAPHAARAQANPSSDQIIRGLMPQGNIGGLTRGIRPSGSAAPPANEAPPPPATPAASSPHLATAPTRPAAAPTQHASAPPAAPANAAAPSINLTVEFRSGSADLTPQAVHALDELGRALASSQLASYRFRIEGHTDTVGTPDANKALSARRAAAVVDYLATTFNVDRSRLEPVGMGEEGLMVATPAQTPEPRNRRVQVVNLSA